MEWYYAADDQRIGPLPEMEIVQLFNSGKISGETLIWRTGMDEWKPYASLFPPPPLSAVSGVPDGGQVTCMECQTRFSESDVVRIGAATLCALCKPIYLQRILGGGRVDALNGVWRRRKILLIGLNTMMPPRCVKCNSEEAVEMIKQRLSWVNPLYTLLLFIPLLFLIVAAALRKRATVYVGICSEHRRRRRRLRWGLGGAFFREPLPPRIRDDGCPA